MILLQADESLEEDVKLLFPADTTRTHYTRVLSDLEVTTETLMKMKDHIGSAAGRFPVAAHFDTVAYCCTSASSVIGEATVEAIVREGERRGTCCEEQSARAPRSLTALSTLTKAHPFVHTCVPLLTLLCTTSGCPSLSLKTVTNPLTAAVAAFKALNVTRVGLVSPYLASVNTVLIRCFKENGIDMTIFGSFGQEQEERVARIDGDSLFNACVKLHEEGQKSESTKFDAVFMSCTNLVTLPVIQRVEEALKIPCLSSNLCLAWHMARLAEFKCDVKAVGSSMLLASDK